MDGYVYFISDGTGWIKIGLANNPLMRLKELQTGNPHKLKIYGLIHFAKYDDARVCESELHEYFEDVQGVGEWFKSESVKSFLDARMCNSKTYEFEGIPYLEEEAY